MDVNLFAEITKNSNLSFRCSKFSIYEILFFPKNNSFNAGKLSRFSILEILFAPNSKLSRFSKETFSIL